MNTSLILKYFTTGDVVKVNLEGQQPFEGKIIEISNEHIAIESGLRMAIIVLNSIISIEKVIPELTERKEAIDTELNQISHSPSLDDIEFAMDRPYISEEKERDETEIFNLAVQLKCSDFFSLEHLFEENKDLIYSNEYLRDLYQQKLSEFEVNINNGFIPILPVHNYSQLNKKSDTEE